MSCTIRASVTTGLEFLAADEVKEKLAATSVEEGRGVISWKEDISCVTKVFVLRSILRFDFQIINIENTGNLF